MFNWIRNIKIGMLHASYHRNIKRADSARCEQDILKFKKYIYKAEDAWRKLVILTEKNKK